MAAMSCLRKQHCPTSQGESNSSDDVVSVTASIGSLDADHTKMNAQITVSARSASFTAAAHAAARGAAALSLEGRFGCGSLSLELNAAPDESILSGRIRVAIYR
jgi:hypothetical protein